MDQHCFVFIGGMPRSGTSALYQLIGSHPDISRLTNTNVIEDEGQWLQDVYPTGPELGGPGRLGLNPLAHLTEDSPLLASARERLLKAWMPYWDMSKPMLCEKSPPNITRSRFLQTVFPESCFIFLSRHPVAYSLAIRKWDYRIAVSTTIRNWLACYRILEGDRPHLRRCLMLRYDDLVRDTAAWARKIEEFIGVGPGIDLAHFRPGHNERYFRSWQASDFRDGPDPLRNKMKRWLGETEIRYVQWRYERDINAFGYSFRELQSA
jgi:hypothetical protein